MRAASIGFRAKTGKAVAVAVSSEGTTPIFIQRWEVALHDPEIPATGQPYHVVMDLPWPEAEATAVQYERRIEAIAIDVLQKLKKELDSRQFDLSAVGIVGSPPRNLQKIGNPHIRAHAAEGILFRRVLETAAQVHQIRNWSFAEKELGLADEPIKGVLTSLGRSAGKPWRADDRAAAAVAWQVLLYTFRSQKQGAEI
jgi:hypothetical protein